MINLDKYIDKWIAEGVNDYIGFYTREFYCLDNFSAFKFVYKGMMYETIEHAYQSLKFSKTSTLIEKEVRNAASPYEAKKIAYQHREKWCLDWHDIKVEIMENLLRAKLTQHPYIQNKLLQTKDYLICEDSPVDDFWGIGKNRDGQNMMGKLWMKLREEIKLQQNELKDNKQIIQIYTDGACSGNPGIGGWGAIIFENGVQKELSGFEPETTNNKMELLAAIKALELVKQASEIELFSDSAYLINAFNEDWITKWLLNGFKNSSNKDVANKELWQKLIDFNQIHKIKWIKVKGHADNEFNNRCDKLATGEIAKHKNEND